MKVYLILLAVVLTVGCNAVRSGVKVVDNAIGVVGAVKDDAIGAVNTLIDVSENVKTNITKGTAQAATSATR